MRIRRLGLVPLLLGLVLGTGLCATARASQLDTSVVRLDLNGRKHTESFEVVDTGETVLLPLGATAKLMDAAVELDPQTLTAKVVRSWDQVVATVDVKRQVLLLGGQELPMGPGAVAGAGDYFVPLVAAERLFDAKIEWQSKTQTITISVDRRLGREKQSEPPNGTAPGDSSAKREDRKPTDAAPLISLGSVQYVITNGRSSDLAEWPVRDELAVDAHLQAGGVPVDLKGKAERFSTDQREWSLDRATATYYSPRLEAVLGDTTLSLGRVVEDANLRGLRFSSPPGWTSGQPYAVTVIEGWVTPGAQVELTLNGYFLGMVTADETGHYRFERVPLQITKANTAVITVTEPDGYRTTETRTIAAMRRLLPQGELATAAGGGWVRQQGQDGWASLLYGGAAYAGVAPWLTLGGEIAKQTPLDDNGKQEYPGTVAGNVGMALRARDNLVFSLDWMVSRPEDSGKRPDQGADLAASLQLGRTAWQGVAFYREKGLSLFSRTQADVKGYRLIGELDLSRSWNWQASYERSESVSDLAQEAKTKAGSVLRWSGNQKSSVLRLERETQGEDRAGDKAEFTYRLTTPKTDLGAELCGAWEENGGTAPRLTNASSRLELRRALGPTAYGSLSRSDQVQWATLQPGNEERPAFHQSATGVELSWFPGKNRIAWASEVKDARWLEGPSDASTGVRHTLDLSRSLGPVIAGVATTLAQDYRGELTDAALVHSLYAGAKKQGSGLSGQVRLDYTRPVFGSSYVESVRATAKSGYQFANGLFLGLTGWSEWRSSGERDYCVGVMLSQGIGFSNGGIRGFKAADGRPLGYVEGTVYLDRNRNGKRDPGEKGLPEVPVFLAGRRKKTDKDGYYCFEFVNPGVYSVGLDPNKLQADYTPTTEARLIRLQPNANCTQDFGVSLNGTAEGTVFLDYDHDGKPGKNEPRPVWVKVLLDGKLESFTDERGNFTFGNLELGSHELTVDPKSLPPGIEPPAPLTLEITEENLDVWDLAVPLTDTAAR